MSWSGLLPIGSNIEASTPPLQARRYSVRMKRFKQYAIIMKQKSILFLALMLFFVQGAWADGSPAVSTELEEYIPLADLQTEATDDVELAQYYRFNYETVDANGDPIVLSSALIAPRDVEATIETVYIYCHYTITANKDAPSQWVWTDSPIEILASVVLMRYLAVPIDHVSPTLDLP